MLNREKIEKLARERANQIIETWWFECTNEFQDEEGITDEELEQVLKVEVMAYTPSEIEALMRGGR